MKAWVASALVASALAQPSGRAKAAGMSATWAVVGESLEVELVAPTRGWVLIGFHDREALAGARLVMGVVSREGAACEEHVANPPRHARRTTGQVATVVNGRIADGQTTLRCQVPLDPDDPSLPTLVPGKRTWVWLAWSHEADLQHHSARREGVWVEL